MNKLKFYAAAIFLFFLSSFIPLHADEFFVGIRTWQADWSPGAIRKKENDTTLNTMRANARGSRTLITVPYAADNVSGFYHGPVFSYIMLDNKLSFSLVGLAGKSGVQGYTEARQVDNVTETSYQTNSVKSKPVRKDIDFTAAYSIIPRFKIFAGLKQQEYEYDIKSQHQGSISFVKDSGLSTEFTVKSPIFGSGKFLINHKYSGPAFGFAYSHPLSENASLSFSLGYFTARGKSKEKSENFITNGRTGQEVRQIYEIQNSENRLNMKGATAEITYTGAITENFYLQIGLRGQKSTMIFGAGTDVSINYLTDKDGSKVTPQPDFYPSSKFTDTFGGFSLSVLYKF